MSSLVKQASLISAADFFRLVIKTVIGIILARLLSKDDYGTYRQLFMLYAIVNAVFLIGIPQSMMFFLPKAESEDKLKVIISQTLDIIVILGFLSLIFLLSLRIPISQLFNNPRLSKSILIFGAYPFLMYINQVFYSILLGLRKPGKAAQFIIFSILCDVVVVLLIAFYTKNLQWIVAAVVFSAFLQLLYARVSIRRWKTANLLASFDVPLFKEQMNFSLPLGLSMIVGIIAVQLDKFLISSYFTPEQFAVFAIGAAELPLIGIITNSVNAVLLPALSAKQGTKEISGLYRGAVRKNALLLFPMFVFCLLYARHIIVFLYTDKYLDAVPFFRIYLMTIPLRIATFGLLFQVFRKTRIIFGLSVLTLIINFVLAFFLIRIIGMKGPAISTISVTWLAVAINIILIRIKLKLHITRLFPLTELLKIMSAAIFAGVAGFLLLRINAPEYLRLTLSIFTTGCTYIVFGYLITAIHPYDKELAWHMIKGAVSKIKLTLRRNRL